MGKDDIGRPRRFLAVSGCLDCQTCQTAQFWSRLCNGVDLVAREFIFWNHVYMKTTWNIHIFQWFFRLHHVFYITFFCGVAMFRTISPSLHQAIRFGLPVNPIDPCPWIEFHLHRKETEETNAFIVFGWSRTEHRNVFYISMSTGSDWRCLTSFFIIFGPSWS